MANILEMLQRYQQAQRAPSMMGPVMPQNPTPGFRMPPEMQMRAPPPQDPGFNLGGFGLGLPRYGSYDPNGYYNNLGGKPGGYSSIDDLLGQATHVANPAGADPSASSGGLFGFLRGLF